MRPANLLDAVDRHLQTEQETRMKASGRYVVALHHWPEAVLQYACRLNLRGLLLPVPTDAARELGIDTMDPLNRFRAVIRPDEFGRLRPVRDQEDNPAEPLQWILVPNRSHQEVFDEADAITLRRIAEQVQEKKHSKAEQQLEKKLLASDAQLAKYKEQIEELERRCKGQAADFQRELAAREAKTKSLIQRLQRKENEVAVQEKEISVLQSNCTSLNQSMELLQAQFRGLLAKVHEYKTGGGHQVA